MSVVMKENIALTLSLQRFIGTTQNMIFSVWLDLVLLPPYHAQH
jgi:hypothetical protein